MLIDKHVCLFPFYLSHKHKHKQHEQQHNKKGVDKPDLEAVVHAAPPRSLEEYVQQVGRAGRDGREGRCVTLLDDGDYLLLRALSHSARVRRESVEAFLADHVFATTAAGASADGGAAAVGGGGPAPSKGGRGRRGAAAAAAADALDEGALLEAVAQQGGRCR